MIIDALLIVYHVHILDGMHQQHIIILSYHTTVAAGLTTLS